MRPSIFVVAEAAGFALVSLGSYLQWGPLALMVTGFLLVVGASVAEWRTRGDDTPQ